MLQILQIMLYNCNSSDGWLLKHNGDLTEVWRTRPERTMSGVVRGMAESSVPVGRLVVEGESGRNELLRGPFALFGVRSSAKLVRDLAKHRRTPMSPPQLIPPTSPGQFFAGDGRLRRRFFRHRTWSVPGADCLQP